VERMPGDKTVQEQNQKVLLDLLALPENRECADCGAKGPRWASCNLGVFLCINCSGVHRSMGTHISKVRSVTLDKWKPEQVKVMQEVGNGKAKEIYEANVPDYHRRPSEHDTHAIEQWIRAKYDRKEFMRRDQAKKEPKTTKESKAVKEKDPTQEKSRTSKTPSNGIAKPLSSSDPGSKRQPQSANVADLLLMDDDSSSLSSQQKKSDGQDQFQGFQSFQAAAPIPNDAFSAFQSATPTPTPTQTNDAFWSGDSGNQPKASKESILQLFSTPLTVPSSNPMTPGYSPQPLPNRGPNYNISLAGLSSSAPVGYPTPVVNPGYNNRGGYSQPVAYPNPGTYGYNQMSTGYIPPTNVNTYATSNSYGYSANPTPSYVNPNFLASMGGNTSSLPMMPIQTPVPISAPGPVVLPTSASNFRL